MKVISFNHEGIFNNAETNITAVKNFVLSRPDMNFPVFVDVRRVAINGACMDIANDICRNLTLSVNQLFSSRGRISPFHWVSAERCG